MREGVVSEVENNKVDTWALEPSSLYIEIGTNDAYILVRHSEEWGLMGLTDGAMYAFPWEWVSERLMSDLLGAEFVPYDKYEIRITVSKENTQILKDNEL